MRSEACEDVMRILPHRFGDDQRAIGIKPAKNFESHFLRIDEAVLFLFVVGIGALNFVAFALDGAGKQLLHAGLFRPAFFVGGRPEITAGNEINRFQVHGVGRKLASGRFRG